MKTIKSNIKKLENMRTDLYQIISDFSAMNEAYKASQNNDRVYFWCGEFYEVNEYDDINEYCDLSLYVLAKTKEEAEVRLKARADKEFDIYQFDIYKVEEDEDGIIDFD